MDQKNQKTILDSTWEVPTYNCVFSESKKNQYCIIVPVINEGDKFLKQLFKMQALNLQADIVIADGGSQDGSMEEVRLKSLGVSALLVKTGAGKLSAQLRMGFAWALQAGYKGVVIIDGNGKDGVDAIPKFLEGLDEGYDFLQGSRYIKGGVAINTPLDRHIAVICVHAPLISLASRYRYTDTTNGFRAFSAGFLTDERVQTFRHIFDTYNLHYYLAIRAARLGFKIKEIPVSRAYPLHGKTPTKISGVKGKLHVLKQLFISVIGGYNPVVEK